MFGFGRSAEEKAVIKLFALQLEALGIHSKEANANSTRLVDEILSDLRIRGVDPFKTTQGNEYAANEKFVTPCMAAGLTIEDIKAHWNRPLLIVLCEFKMREMFNFIIVDIARQQGKDIEVAAQNYKKSFPRYGDPTRWDASEKFNAGLRQEDSYIYPEFATRIEAWSKKTSESETIRLIEHYGTMNAAIRHFVASSAL